MSKQGHCRNFYLHHLILFVTHTCSALEFFPLFVQISLRDSLAAQLEITLTKADSEQLARSIAEEQYSDLEKEKIMKELELKEMMARHRQELAEKDITITSVCSQHSLDFTHNIWNIGKRMSDAIPRDKSEILKVRVLKLHKHTGKVQGNVFN